MQSLPCSLHMLQKWAMTGAAVNAVIVAHVGANKQALVVVGPVESSKSPKLVQSSDATLAWTNNANPFRVAFVFPQIYS